MCGIGGVCSNCDRISTEVLDSISADIARRGPDDHGRWLSSQMDVGFVHRRLTVLDLSSKGHQPMLSPDGRFVIVYNGEVYNFRGLRDELINEGVHFQSECDTEVVLRLWEREGHECLKRLRGMYAFAIWDVQERDLFLIRDPLGIKPLYYTSNRGELLFSSSAKALVKVGKGKGVCPEGVHAFLGWGSIPSPLTLWDGVHAVEPGTVIRWSQATEEVSRTPFEDFRAVFSQTPSIAEDATAVQHVRVSLQDSVEAHLVSDVPVGVFLSGGIDSSAILSLLQHYGHREVRTFSLVYDEPDLDESDFALLAAEKFGSTHETWRIDNSVFEAYMPDFLRDMDQPTIDGFNTWLVSRFARERGIKVVMSGVGADEVFAGYETVFRTYPRIASHFQYIPAFLRSCMAVACEALTEAFGWHGRLRKIHSLLCNPGMPEAYACFRNIFSHNEIRRILVEPMANAISDRSISLRSAVSGMQDCHLLRKLTVLEAQFYLMSQLLMDADAFSMCHGLELRTPFVDKQLWASLGKVCPARFVSDTSPKPLLVKAIGNLPGSLVNRPKGTFTLPFESWIRCHGLTGKSGLLERYGGVKWRELFVEKEIKGIEQAFLAGRVHWSRCWAIIVLAAKFAA